ncbi:MAG: hypothetical protein K2I10_05660, partial [Lachnospiraceae bacterium]|nr:hypothetical protein [Lachnospiraceae bacterium]
MKNVIEIFYVSLNVLYYAGIALLVYLYAIDDNTAMWMIAEGMVVVGLLSIIIPDMLINIEVGNISVPIVRSVILNKYLLFCIVHMWLNKYFLLVKVLVGMSVLIDLILEVCLIKQMNSACISLDEFIENLNKFDTT